MLNIQLLYRRIAFLCFGDIQFSRAPHFKDFALQSFYSHFIEALRSIAAKRFPIVGILCFHSIASFQKVEKHCPKLGKHF